MYRASRVFLVCACGKKRRDLGFVRFVLVIIAPLLASSSHHNHIAQITLKPTHTHSFNTHTHSARPFDSRQARQDKRGDI